MSYMPALVNNSRKRSLQPTYCNEQDGDDSDIEVIPCKQAKEDDANDNSPTIKGKLFSFFHWMSGGTHLKSFINSIVRRLGNAEDSADEFEQVEEMPNHREKQKVSTTPFLGARNRTYTPYFEKPNRFLTLRPNSIWIERNSKNDKSKMSLKENRDKLTPESRFNIQPNFNGYPKERALMPSSDPPITFETLNQVSQTNSRSFQFNKPHGNQPRDIKPAPPVDQNKDNKRKWLPPKPESLHASISESPPFGILQKMVARKGNGYLAPSRSLRHNYFTTNEVVNKKERDSYQHLINSIYNASNMKAKSLRSTEVQVESEDIDKTIKKPLSIDKSVLSYKKKTFLKQSDVVKPKLATRRPVFREVLPEEICYNEEDKPFTYQEAKQNKKIMPQSSAIFFSPKWIEDLKISLEEGCKDRLKKVEEQIQLIEECKKKKLLLSGLLTEEKKHEIDNFPELTPEMELIIENALMSQPDNEVLSMFNQQRVLRKDMDTLKSTNWLNDEVINFYLSLIVDRSTQSGFPSVYTFNSFFYTSLNSKGYPAVKRWTRKVDVFSYDILLIPLHLGVHWCLAVIDFRQKKLKYYDSMGGKDTALTILRQYLSEESLDKKKAPFDWSGWSSENMKDIPPQMNGYDCGMFTLKYAEYITKDAPITFSQQNMHYFRRKMVFDIMMKKIS